MHDVLHRRRRCDQGEIELPFEALPDDLHVEEAEEPAAESESECRGRTGQRRDRLTGASLAHVLDAGDEVADLSCAKRCDRSRVGSTYSHLFGVVHRTGLYELESRAGIEGSVHDPDR